jgi:hypothetical protein
MSHEGRANVGGTVPGPSGLWGEACSLPCALRTFPLRPNPHLVPSVPVLSTHCDPL